jgi:serine/threonine-protein kinase RsbW
VDVEAPVRFGRVFAHSASEVVRRDTRPAGKVRSPCFTGDRMTTEVRVASQSTSVTGGPGYPKRDFVEVRLPAAGAYLSVLRTATAGLAARLDFTLDEIEDLRIAVDEACALLLQQAVAGSDLTCVFELDTSAMRVTVSAPTTDGRTPSQQTFAWTVLTALAGEVEARAEDGTVSISLHKHRGAAQPPSGSP